MNISEIDPHIRFADFITLSHQKSEHYAYDHRIFYVTSGRGTVEFGGEKNGFSEGHTIVIPSGIGYRFCSEEPFSLISINFDYTHSRADVLESLPIVLPENFDRKRVVEHLAPSGMERPAVISKTEELYAAYLVIVREFTERKNLYRELAASELKSVIIRLMRLLATGTRTESKVSAIIEYLREHYGEELTNTALSERFGYHPYHLNRLMKASTGMTLHQYIILVRMESAKKLLAESDLSVTEIARLCGYDNTGSFSRDFRKRADITPLRYRERTRSYN